MSDRYVLDAYKNLIPIDDLINDFSLMKYFDLGAMSDEPTYSLTRSNLIIMIKNTTSNQTKGITFRNDNSNAVFKLIHYVDDSHVYILNLTFGLTTRYSFNPGISGIVYVVNA